MNTSIIIAGGLGVIVGTVTMTVVNFFHIRSYERTIKRYQATCALWLENHHKFLDLYGRQARLITALNKTLDEVQNVERPAIH